MRVDTLFLAQCCYVFSSDKDSAFKTLKSDDRMKLYSLFDRIPTRPTLENQFIEDKAKEYEHRNR